MYWNTNLGTTDRKIRLVGGAALIGWALFGFGGWRHVGWLGVIPIATALISWCPLYHALGLSTRSLD